MTTRGKDKRNPGRFEYCLYDGFTLVERVGGFATAQLADRAAEVAQRQQLFPSNNEPSMSDDELLAALLS